MLSPNDVRREEGWPARPTRPPTAPPPSDDGEDKVARQLGNLDGNMRPLQGLLLGLFFQAADACDVSR